MRPQDLSAYEGCKSRRISYVVRERMYDGHWLPPCEVINYRGGTCRLAVPSGSVYVRRKGRAIWAGTE